MISLLKTNEQVQSTMRVKYRSLISQFWIRNQMHHSTQVTVKAQVYSTLLDFIKSRLLIHIRQGMGTCRLSSCFKSKTIKQ